MKLSVNISAKDSRMPDTATFVYGDEAQSVSVEMVPESRRQRVAFGAGSTELTFVTFAWHVAPFDVDIPAVPQSPEVPAALLLRAQRRLEEIQELIATSSDEEDEPQEPLSDHALRTAINVIRELPLGNTISQVGIFPTPQGGVVLQTIGPRRTVAVDIPAAGDAMKAKFSDTDVYHRETVRNPTAAANFLAVNTR